MNYLKFNYPAAAKGFKLTLVGVLRVIPDTLANLVVSA